MPKSISTLIVLVLFSFKELDAVSVVEKSAISCYSCLGTQCSRPTLINQTAVCSDPLDSCITVFTGYTVDARGCSMDVPDIYRQKCVDGSSLECHKCTGSFCNNVAREDVQCLQCDSSSDPRCLQHPANLQMTRCSLSVSPNSYCFVSYNEEVIKRGCSLNVRDQLSCYNSDVCMLCLPSYGQACNAVEFPANRRKCVVCSDGCASSNSTTTYCQKIDDQCVSMKMNGKVRKGCVESLSESDNKYCTDNKNMCSKCSSNVCNQAEFNPNSSDIRGASILLCSLLVLLTFVRKH